MTALTAGVWVGLGQVSNPRTIYELLSASSFVTLTIPFVMALALSVVCGLLAVFLGVLCLPAWLLRRPTGFGGLLEDLSAVPAPIVPRYFAVLLGLRSPLLRGFFFGCLLATAYFSLCLPALLAAQAH